MLGRQSKAICVQLEDRSVSDVGQRGRVLVGRTNGKGFSWDSGDGRGAGRWWLERRSLITGTKQSYEQQQADEEAPADDYQEEAQDAPPPPDPADEIEHLAQLHASGALTDEEFADGQGEGAWVLNACRTARDVRTGQ